MSIVGIRGRVVVRVTSETNARGKTREYTYDIAGNLARSIDRNGRVIQYTYDPVNNRTELSATLDGQADFINSYTYDKLRRLTEVTQTGQAGATWYAPKRVTQAFNSIGQRTNISRYESLGTSNPVATTDFLYDSANRLDGIEHKQGTTNLNTYSYVFDPMSRIESVTSTAEGLTTYDYDLHSQVEGADNTWVADESYTYDDAGTTSIGSAC